jgi:hypothetical protein
VDAAEETPLPGANVERDVDRDATERYVQRRSVVSLGRRTRFHSSGNAVTRATRCRKAALPP